MQDNEYDSCDPEASGLRIRGYKNNTSVAFDKCEFAFGHVPVFQPAKMSGITVLHTRLKESKPIHTFKSPFCTKCYTRFFNFGLDVKIRAFTLEISPSAVEKRSTTSSWCYLADTSFNRWGGGEWPRGFGLTLTSSS